MQFASEKAVQVISDYYHIAIALEWYSNTHTHKRHHFELKFSRSQANNFHSFIYAEPLLLLQFIFFFLLLAYLFPVPFCAA
jgi:hypothetical protein